MLSLLSLVCNISKNNDPLLCGCKPCNDQYHNVTFWVFVCATDEQHKSLYTLSVNRTYSEVVMIFLKVPIQNLIYLK